jgi:nicotinate-nucleotide adenylyltransferase
MTVMKKIGILGGTFDPPHLGHLIMAEQVLDLCGLDEVRFMPNNLPPHKVKASNSTTDDRFRMLKLAISDQPLFQIEAIELERDGKSYTYDTMVLLKDREPDNEFYFIIGGDMIDYLPKWYKVDELFQLVHFIGVKRPTYIGETDYPVKFVNTPSIHLSSSMLREKIAKGESVKYLLPDQVINYIEVKGLYGKK